jgi:4-hydroxy-tetrahydrodipicolinate synthase
MECSTQRALANLRELTAAGAQFATLLPPYYLPLKQPEIIEFYTRLADASALPLMLYNNIEVSKVGMTPETVAQLAAHPNIISIKESSGDLRVTQQILHATAEVPEFSVIAGSDQLALATLLAGGHGLICSFGLLAPQLYLAIARAAKAGDLPAAREHQRKLVKLARLIFGSGSSIALTKYALSRMGLCAPHVCAPSAAPSSNVKQQLDQLLEL